MPTTNHAYTYNNHSSRIRFLPSFTFSLNRLTMAMIVCIAARWLSDFLELYGIKLLSSLIYVVAIKSRRSFPLLAEQLLHPTKRASWALCKIWFVKITCKKQSSSYFKKGCIHISICSGSWRRSEEFTFQHGNSLTIRILL